MDFRVLGPLEVWDGERPLTLGGAKQRALLGMLLLHANRVVSTESLTDALWGEVHPERASNALQVYIATIRKLLEPERAKGAPSLLLAKPPGYMLRVDHDHVDLNRFEQLVKEAQRELDTDPAAASGLLHDAISLWRGPALCDIVLEGSARGEIDRLDELRIAALEDRIHADLELGRHAALIGELEALVAAHPVRERLCAQLMLALYRCGRQAEALKAYLDARHMLSEELGLDPSPELQSLERAILQQDPALGAPPRVVPVGRAPAPATVRLKAAPAPPAAARRPTAPVHAAGPAPPARGPERPTPRGRVAAAPAAPRPAPAAARPAPAAAKARPDGGSTVVRRRRPRLLIGAAALLIVAGAFGGLLLHPWSSGSTGSNNGPSTGATVGGPFPNAQERDLMARFPAFVGGCHRYADHYAKAIAEVECNVAADHPGARTVTFQSFANYLDLEQHFHHVLALKIQSETGRQLSNAYPGACTNSGTFFAFSNYPTTGEVQDSVTTPTSRGHLFCYLDHTGVPRLAWTNVGWLVVAQVDGNGTGGPAQNGLLALWEFAGPVGTPVPDPAVANTPAAVVAALYERYLLRKPEDGAAVQYWVDRLGAIGYGAVINEIAGSAEAKVRITQPILKQGMNH
jgi:DNA-binding SARP family transcriptional activator